jgi:hypothetical protein
MERFVVLQHIKYKDNLITTKSLYATGSREDELLKKLCDDFRARQAAKENIMFTPSRELINAKYYEGVKVETLNSEEYYYIIPFNPVSIRDWI